MREYFAGIIVILATGKAANAEMWSAVTVLSGRLIESSKLQPQAGGCWWNDGRRVALGVEPKFSASLRSNPCTPHL